DSRRQGGEQDGGGAVLPRAVQSDASFRLRRDRARILHVQRPRERLPDLRRLGGSTSSRIRNCWCRTRGAASAAAASCAKPSSTTPTRGTALSCTVWPERWISRWTRRGKSCPSPCARRSFYGIDPKKIVVA